MIKSLPKLRLFKIVVPILIIGLSFLWFTKSGRLKDPFEENEENESAAEVTGSFDMWSDMRSYPDYANFQRASYKKAFDYSSKMPSRPRQVGLSTSDLESFPAWQPLGPMNFSGRILSLAFHPTDPLTMFAGSASGGLWKTTNGGTGAVGGINWQQVPTGFSVIGVPAIAINPLNANEMYIGTGEVYNTGGNGFPGQNVRTFRGSYGIGILKSTNGGSTWTSSLSFPNTSIKGVQEIIIDPVTPANVFAATSDGVYRSTNSGASWTLIHSVIMAMDICINPGDANVLYVADGDFGSTGSGVYKCTNALAATPAFAKLAGGFPTSLNGRIAVNICPNNNNLIYASVGKIPGTSGGTEGTTYGLFKSTDAGATWAAVGSLIGSNYIQNQGWYSHDVIVGPSGTNIFVSEIDMLRSTDGGANFSQRTDWSKWNLGNSTIDPATEGTTNGNSTTTAYVHADQHHLYFSPHDATYNTIFVVSDGGVFKSTDGGNSFKGLNGGLMTTQIYHNMSTSATNSNYMLCGLQDNATLWYQGTPGCKRVTGGDGFYTVIDPTNDQICFGTYSYMSYYRSTTGPTGLSSFAWQNTVNAGTSLPTENAAFVAPIVMAPSDHTRMYGGTVNFKKSINNGSSFTNVSTNVVNSSAPIISIGVSSTYADSVYITSAPGGAANPKVLLSTNGGTSFVDRTGTLPNRYFAYVEVDPTNSKRVAVAVSGFGTGHVYLTPDAGVTWNDISGTGGTALPDVPANVVMFDPANPSTIYVGNDLGVYAAQSVTNGVSPTSWVAYNVGLTDATMVMDILVAPNGKLRIGTYGKGLWENAKINFALPVVFKDLTVSSSDKGNQLNWIVSSQAGVNNYEPEYSTDGIHFNKIASVVAINNSSEQTYTYLHPIQNTVDGYYRIKIINQDGSAEYSMVKNVKAGKVVTRLSVYPNPTTGAFKIILPMGSKGTVSLKIYDNGGKLVMQKKVEVQAGVRDLPVDISKMAAGYYQVVCENGTIKSTTSILKK